MTVNSPRSAATATANRNRSLRLGPRRTPASRCSLAAINASRIRIVSVIKSRDLDWPASTDTTWVARDNVSRSRRCAHLIDHGPTAGCGSLTEGHGKTANLTALINGLVVPSIAGDSETLINVIAASGTAILSSGNSVTDSAPAVGPDTITYTVADQYGDTAAGHVAVTVDPGPTAGDAKLGPPPMNARSAGTNTAVT
jgi:hypothetical protein